MIALKKQKSETFKHARRWYHIRYRRLCASNERGSPRCNRNIVYVIMLLYIVIRQRHYNEITVLSRRKLLLCEEVKRKHITRKRIRGRRDCRYVSDIISANRTGKSRQRGVPCDYCVGSLRMRVAKRQPLMSPVHDDERPRYLLAFRVFDIRNAHESWSVRYGTAIALGPRCDYMVSVTYTHKKVRTLYAAAYY